MKQMLALKPMLITLYLGLLVLALLAAGWFLVRAQTWTGVGLAVVAMLVVTLPAPLAVWLSQPGQRAGWGWISLALALAGLGLMGSILLFTPTGVPSPDSPVRHRFSGPAGPRPALVFLHGSLGNFKTYTWVWSKLAEREGMIIIAPSYGSGNWRYEDSLAVVSAALADAAAQAEIDPDRIYLAGLSNGGLGVSQMALAQPERFRGLIFLSPVMDTQILSSPAFLERWSGRPVLVITGAADERIPLAYVRQRIAGLEAGGVAVTEKIYPGEDHFLFFSQPESILAEVQRWLTATGEISR